MIEQNEFGIQHSECYLKPNVHQNTEIRQRF